MKKNLLCLFLSAFLAVLAGCGDERESAGEYLPVAEFIEPPLKTYEGILRNMDFCRVEDELFCLESRWVSAGEDEEYGHMESHLWAVPAEGEGTARILAQETDGVTINLFALDRTGGLYLYEHQGFGTGDGRVYRWYLRKLDGEGREIYCTEMDSGGEGAYGMCADEEGNVVLLLPGGMGSRALFYDSQGRYRGQDALPWGEYTVEHHCTNNVVCAGEQGYFLWDISVEEEALLLWEVDFQEGSISDEAVTIGLKGLTEERHLESDRDCALLSGGELGLLVSMKNILWRYDLGTGAAEEVLRWDAPEVEVDGRHIAQVRCSTPEEGGVPLDILFYDFCVEGKYRDPMAAHIAYVDSAHLEKRREISVGLGNSFGDIERLLRNFNRHSSEYRVVAAEYRPEELKELLMYGRDVPDLLDITGIRTQWLESKGLLEDLTPYFEQSGEVRREDILPAVWELMEGRAGKVTRMATGFTISSMTTAASLPEDGWDYDRYLSLGEEHPESWYFHRYDTAQVWGMITATAQSEFIDWEEKRCSFDCGEFKELLERTAGLNYPPHRKERGGTKEERREDVASGRVLFGTASYGSSYDLNYARTVCGDRLKNVGVPTADGEPLFFFSPSHPLAIYAESPCKEGAWAFLEFLLSRERQDWYSSVNDTFPVRREAFETYLARERYENMTVMDDVEEYPDTPERLRYMAEHMGMSQNAADEVLLILSEESQAYFAGDKDLDETARVIQNRVQLYLDEM